MLCCWGCATTSVGPSVIRFEPLDPRDQDVRIGIRTGPRLSSGIADLESGALRGTEDIFRWPDWGLIWDVTGAVPIAKGFAFHWGAQAEFAVIPLPAIGAMVGLSHLSTFGQFSLAPALAVRGGTDFGLKTSIMNPGSALSVEASVSLSLRAHDWVRVGLVPFVSYQQSWGNERSDGVIFTGAIVDARFSRFDVILGVGRVIVLGGSVSRGFNVPLLGIRVGDL